jgi:hypothetical protein
MKTTLKITTLFLTAIAPCAAIAAVAGFAEPAAFNSDIVVPLIAIAGLQLVAMTDHGRRQAIDLDAAPAAKARGALPHRCCGLRRECAVA